MEAFDFVSFAQMYEHEAFLCKKTGKIYWYSEFGDNFEELPKDINDEKYISIPHKKELGLGNNLVLNFARDYLPDKVKKIELIFQTKGAYAKFKDLLDQEGITEKWYEFESQAHEKALKDWCKENKIKFTG